MAWQLIFGHDAGSETAFQKRFWLNFGDPADIFTSQAEGTKGDLALPSSAKLNDLPSLPGSTA